MSWGHRASLQSTRRPQTAIARSPVRTRSGRRVYPPAMGPVEASYEHGSLKLFKPLALRIGERVSVVVLCRPDPSRWDFPRLAAAKDVELSEAELAYL